MAIVEHLSAMEILDSRGRPTVMARCKLTGGPMVSASVPSGASTGKAEAHELRDGDLKRYGGLGCMKAVANVDGPIARAVRGKAFESQAEFDRRLITLDGTRNKSRLGANAILACSLAVARAVAQRRRIPLYRYFAELIDPREEQQLPRMTINLFSGGKHAGGQVEIQDVLMVPHARTIAEGLAQSHAVYYAAAKLGAKKYGTRLLRADEGGLAPPARSVEAMLDDAVEAIRSAGLRIKQDMSLAIDVAATHFYRRGRYEIGGKRLTSTRMIERVISWAVNWPIYTVEDGLAENDWENWGELTLKMATETGASTIGDDLLCTNPRRIQRAINNRSATMLLLKVNQIGTLTEAAEAWRVAKSAAWPVVVSARSGETEDTWLADLAVAWGDQIKVGSITQSERLAKYNRLLQIEQETRWPVANYPSRIS
jgi:enolase